MTPFLLPIGSDRRLVEITDPGLRSVRQAVAVRRLLPHVHYVCGEPFKLLPDDRPRSIRPRSFWFTFYGRDNQLHSVRLSPTGKVTKEMLVGRHGYETTS